MIYDCFIFSNELDLLEIRLNELKDIVDKFVLVEAPVSHQNEAKPLIYGTNKDSPRFAEFKDRIIHVVVNDMPRTGDPGVREKFQRKAIMRGLVGCKPNDVIMISDVDEIPKAQALSSYKQSDGRARFAQHFCYYYLNYISIDEPIWNGTKILNYQELKGTDPDTVRWSTPGVTLPNGGWHFSYVGGVDMILAKLRTFSHEEMNVPAFTDTAHIASKMKSGADLFNRNKQWRHVAVGDWLPSYVLDNLGRFKDMIKDTSPVVAPIQGGVRSIGNKIDVKIITGCRATFRKLRNQEPWTGRPFLVECLDSIKASDIPVGAVSIYNDTLRGMTLSAEHSELLRTAAQQGFRVVNNHGGGVPENFLETLADTRKGYNYTLVLEDDVIVSHNILARLNEWLARNDVAFGSIYNCFGYHDGIVPYEQFWGGQGLFFRNDIIPKMIFAATNRQQTIGGWADKVCYPDLVYSRIAGVYLKVPCHVHKPSLVQHIGNISHVPGHQFHQAADFAV